MSDQCAAIEGSASSEAFRVQIDLFGGGQYVLEFHGSRSEFINKLFTAPACMFSWDAVVEYSGVDVPEGATIAVSAAAIVQFVISPVPDAEAQP